MDIGTWWAERSREEKLLVGVAAVVVAVVAVLLVVALVVVGAAVLGTFALGLGSQPVETTSQVSFEFEYADGEVRITHAGGDTVEADRLAVVIDGERRPWPGSGTVSAGDRVTVTAGPGATVRVVYRGEDRRATLGEYRVPG